VPPSGNMLHRTRANRNPASQVPIKRVRTVALCMPSNLYLMNASQNCDFVNGTSRKADCRDSQLLAEIGNLGLYDAADALMKNEILFAPEQMRRVLSPPFRRFRGTGLQRLDSGPNFDHEARLTLRLTSQHRE
jgi:hypothetical protein